MSSKVRSWIGWGGLLFVVIVVVSIAVAGASTPDSNASLAKIVSYYQQHRSGLLAGAYLLELGVLVGLVFFWYLREMLIEAGADRLLVNVGFAGVILFAVSGALSGGLHLTLWDSVHHASPVTLQTLNSLSDDLATILAGVGQALFLLATGLAVVRSGAMARWLGWSAVVLGVIAFALPFVGPLWAGVWVVVASIAILVGARSEEPARGAIGTAGAG